MSSFIDLVRYLTPKDKRVKILSMIPTLLMSRDPITDGIIKLRKSPYISARKSFINAINKSITADCMIFYVSALYR